MNPSQSTLMPLHGGLSLNVALTWLVSLLILAACLVGLFFPEVIYPSQELRANFVANDLVGIIVGVAILIGAMLRTNSGDLLGLIFWPGAFFYSFYNYIVYLGGVPLGLISLLYLAIVLVCAWGMFSLWAGIDHPAVKTRFDERTPAWLGGAALALFGLIFLMRAIGMVAQAWPDVASIAASELALLAADALAALLWITGGVAMLRRTPFGISAGTGMLFQASMLFVGLLLFFALQPFVSTAGFRLADFIVILAMSLVCFVPFALIVRGFLPHR